MNLVFRVAIQLGLRRGELLGLQWQDIDWSAATIHIVRQVEEIDGDLVVGPIKDKQKERRLPLPPRLWKRLRERWQEYEAKRQKRSGWNVEGFIFPSQTGTAYYPSNLDRLFNRVLKETNLGPLRLHDLRHTCATRLRSLRAEKSVISAILGHEAEDVTDHYAEVEIEATRHALTLLEDALFGGDDDEA